MSAPRISVVLAVKDDRGGLARTVDSVLGQTFADLELIVVDDGSRDATPALLADYARRDPRVQVVTHPENRGLTPSINAGLSRARAGWVARIDEGDAWTMDKLALQWARLQAEPELVLLGCQYVHRSPRTGEVVHRPRVPTDDRTIRRQLLGATNPIVQPAAVFRRFPGLRYNEAPHLPRGTIDPVSDYELWLRLSFLGRLGNSEATLLDISYGADYDGLTTRRTSAQFDMKLRVHAAFLEVLQTGDPAAAARAVREGFQLPGAAPAAPSPLRQRSFRLRYQASYVAEPRRSLLRGLGYLLDPPALWHHAWSKAVLPWSLRELDWCGRVDPSVLLAGAGAGPAGEGDL